MNAHQDNTNAGGCAPEPPEFTVGEIEKAIDLFIGQAPARGVDQELWAARKALHYLRRRRAAALQAQREDAKMQATYAEAKRKQEIREKDCSGDLAFERAVKYIIGVERWDRALPLFKQWLAYNESRWRARGMIIAVKDESGDGLGGAVTLAAPSDFKPVEEAVENFLQAHRDGTLPKAEVQLLRATFVAEEQFFRDWLNVESGKKGSRSKKKAWHVRGG